jgi:serine-type D-Ala-D-Ala carboxypeptidase (penicillin-binding protein 5/6)
MRLRRLRDPSPSSANSAPAAPVPAGFTAVSEVPAQTTGPAAATPADTAVGADSAPSGAAVEEVALATMPEVPPSWGPPTADPSLRGEVVEGSSAVGPSGNGSSGTTLPGGPAVSKPAPARRSRWLRRARRPQHRRDRPRRRLVLAILAAVVVLAAAAGTVVAVRLQVPLPLAVVRTSLPSAVAVPGEVPTVAWPTGVESAYTIPSLGVSDESGPEVPVPIASVTKLMTAYVVLHDHPLASGQSGPSITITPNDVGIYEDDVASGETNIEVQTGEVLSELQLLEGMLVHSANNFADLLAVWDAGTTATFVAKMNAAATSLGMTQTNYTDPSGYTPTTVSTAADQLKVAAQDMANPLFAQIVNLPSVVLPVAGTVTSYTPLLGLDDVVGVKSGFTSAAGGCDVLALANTVDGVRVVVLVAVFGYRGGVDVLDPAGLEALSVARSAISGVRVDDVVRPGQQVGTASAGGYSVPVVARGSASVVVWPGQQVTESFVLSHRPRSGAERGSPVGTLTIGSAVQKSQVRVQTGRRLPTPTFWQRVF